MLNFGREFIYCIVNLLIRNTSCLVHTEKSFKKIYEGRDMSTLNTLNNGYILILEGRIAEFGTETRERIQEIRNQFREIAVEDANGGMVFPSWVDSHTHIVFAGSREQEFVDRIKGLSYMEIFHRGGGILNSVKRLRSTPEDELFHTAWNRLDEMIRMGTGAVEIKSGYGLDTESELKMLRVIRRIREKAPVPVKATFLGAHAVPEEFSDNREGYIRFLTGELIPEIGKQQLADYCDVFCEKGYFTDDDSRRILRAASGHGMIPKVHAEQLSHSGGIRAGVDCGAISVDHLEFANEEDIRLLKNTGCIPTLLPGAQFFLGLQHPPARKMLEAGLPLALATDYNPGSSPAGNMSLAVSLACILYKMTPEEAIIAATTNAAAAIGLSEEYGSICVGKVANLFITRPVPSYAFLPYSFGTILIHKIILKGSVYSGFAS